MSNLQGYIPDGSGPEGAAFGKDPVTGRAFKRNGEVRKARTVKTANETLQALLIDEQRAAATMGRKILASMAGFAAFLGAFGKFRAWVREAKAHSTEDGIAKRRAYLEQQLSDLDAKREAAVAFLSEQGTAIEQANGVFAKVGEACIAFTKANKRPPTKDETESLVASMVDSEAVTAVERSTNPTADPFLAFRRDSGEADSEPSDDDDTL